MRDLVQIKERLETQIGQAERRLAVRVLDEEPPGLQRLAAHQRDLGRGSAVQDGRKRKPRTEGPHKFLALASSLQARAATTGLFAVEWGDMDM